MNNIKIFENDLPSDIDLSNEKIIAIDNEALGLVLGRDPLTLVQLGLQSKQFFLIKLNRETYKAPNLVKILSNSATKFVMHYARQDLLWLKYHLDVQPKNIFCTKVASKIARTASSYHGYKDLVKELCGKDISKKEQQSDWGNPNLSTKQINYAAQDTEYLFEIKDKLTKMLIREKRIDLFEKCMKVIPVLVDMEIAGYKLKKNCIRSFRS
jgi:ribonuclease D